MEQIPILGVAGWSGSGKTTLIEALLPELRSRGVRTAVIKHDGHDFAVDQRGKDSWRFTQAGAEVTVLFSGTRAVIWENRPLRPAEVAGRITGVDLILVEGCKDADWPKLLVCGEGAEKCLAGLREYAAVVTDSPVCGQLCFSRSDIAGLADFICSGRWRTDGEQGWPVFRQNNEESGGDPLPIVDNA